FNLTDIPIHVQGRIRVGTDFIAFTRDADTRVVDYFMPGDTEARGIENAENYDNDSFEVSGTKLILADAVTSDRAFGITIFDTATGTFSAISMDDIRLANIPIGNYVAGFFVADGDYVATRNDAGSVADGNIVKVIDISGDEPTIISFPNVDGISSGLSVQQVSVDAASGLALAISGDVIFVYSLDDPEAAPTQFDLSEVGVSDVPVAFDNGIVLLADDTTDNQVWYLDVTDGANAPVMITTSGRDADFLTLNGDNYGFLYQGPASQGSTAAIGVLPSTEPNISDGETVLSNSANFGRFGYGDTMAYGSGTWFLGDIDDVSTSGLFQFSTDDGASFSVTGDPRDTMTELPVSDVNTNAEGTLLAFKHEVPGVDEQLVGYVELGE
ncbi:MAG: hypothetical protein ACPGXK_06615, partial [Phycisphaerae bacterium]